MAITNTLSIQFSIIKSNAPLVTLFYMWIIVVSYRNERVRGYQDGFYGIQGSTRNRYCSGERVVQEWPA